MRLENKITQYGYSLTEVMIAMALLGGVSLVGMKLVEENSSNESYIRFKSEVSKTTAILKSNLANRKTCESMIGGRNQTSTISPELTFVRKVPGLPDVTVSLLRENTNYGNFFIPAGGIRLEPSRSNSTENPVTDLVITFQVKKRSLFLRKNPANNEIIIERIPVKTELAGSAIRSCGTVVGDANEAAKRQLCDGLQGAAIWSEAEGECRLLDFRCPDGQVPFQLTSLGSFQCVPAEQKINPDTLFDYSSSSCAPGQRVRLTTTPEQKIKVECY